ncbi:MAG TPA: tetratricopeptide repeat protein [Symbiobacteriaceae bacterium]|nr:tetratricopeptide repeat protein [Symbiobacteriaceae bacterium]
MANCQNCGSELTGPYCNTCGARAPEDRAPKKANKPAAAHKPQASGGRQPGLFSPQRIGKTTATGLLVLLGFGAGTVLGYWLGTNGSTGGPLTSTTTDATAQAGGLLPIAVAGQYMDEGVDFLNKGDRTSATASFRKAIAEYEKVLKAEPENLYAQSYLGLTYYYAGDSKKALEHEQAVLKKDENYLWAIFNLAWIYETADKKAESLLMYKKYLAVVDKEKENTLKYAEQFELIDRQVEAAKKAVAAAEGGGTK